MDCNVGCNCGKSMSYNPVCSFDRSTTFYSPCYAGCTLETIIDGGIKVNRSFVFLFNVNIIYFTIWSWFLLCLVRLTATAPVSVAQAQPLKECVRSTAVTTSSYFLLWWASCGFSPPPDVPATPLFSSGLYGALVFGCEFQFRDMW